MKRLCYKCFSELPENANYCPNCGEPIREQEVKTTPPGTENKAPRGFTCCNIGFVFEVECSECGRNVPWAHELKATIEDGELKITKGETLIYHSKLKRVMCTQCALKMGGDAS